MPQQPYLVGLIGAGIGPSLTPPIHMAEAKALGLDYVYRTIDIADLGIEHAPQRGSYLFLGDHECLRGIRLGAHYTIRTVSTVLITMLPLGSGCVDGT